MSKSKKRKKQTVVTAEQREEQRRQKAELQSKQNRRVMLLLAGIVLCVVISIACIAAAMTSKPVVYTAGQYAQLENGMSYEAVVELMGSKGSVISGGGQDGEGVQTYLWANEDNSHISVTFVDGEVKAFSQKNLPAED